MFSVTVFYDERVVIVAEQRPDASEEDSFQWMSRVLQVHHLQSHSTNPYTQISCRTVFFRFLLINQAKFVCFFFFLITLLNMIVPFPL